MGKLLKGGLVLFFVGLVKFAKPLFLATMLFSIWVSNSFGQNSLDDLNVIFKHDFENNTLGTYVYKEWQRDFLSPEWCDRQYGNTIVQKTADEDNPTKTMQLNFPANSVGPSEGGTQWWTIIPKQDELYFSYDILFMPGFQYQLGGKLPSIRGGDLATNDGFVRPSGYDGFSGGMMFKQEGLIAFYTYFPGSNITRYGETIFWGKNYSSEAFSPAIFKVGAGDGITNLCTPGKWHNITIRMSLNSLKQEGEGNYDGILEGYFDGKLVIQVSKMLFRHTAKLGIDIINMTAFFGGDGDSWRNPIEEWIRIDNVIAYTFKDNMDVPRNNELSPFDRTINIWRTFSENHTNLTEPTEFKSTSQSTSTITLNWEYKSSDEQGFQIERTMVPNGDFVPIATVAANSNSYTDTGLDPERLYYYRIKAFNATDSSSYATLNQVTSPVLINNAEKVGFTEIFANAIGVINRRALPVTMFESGTISSITVYHDGGAGNALLGIYNTSETLPGQRIATTSPTPVNTSAGWQTFKLTTPVEVSKGSTIWLAWVFENAISLHYTSGELGRAHSEETFAAGLPQAFGSSTVSATIYSIYANYVPTQTIAQIPNAPSNLHVIQSDHASATIGWSDNAQNENGFEIERINTTDDTRKTFAMGNNAVNLADNGLTENTTYQYRIRAFNDEGSSAWSELLTVITPQEVAETPVITEPVDPANSRPVMVTQQFNITEQSLKDNILGTVSASDPDGHKLSFAIISGNQHGLFSINSQTGILSLTTNNIFGPGTLVFLLTVSVTDNAPNPASTNATVTIKLTGASNRVYIDPENTNDPLANGSHDHPFDAWSDVVWKTGFTYLQKRGTTTSADKILIGANMVTLGAYGEGDLPVINSNTNTYLISGFEKAGITVRELNLQAPNAVSSIYFLGNAGDSIIVEYCQLNANVNAVKVANGNTLVVRYNSISSHGEGVYSSATDNQVYYNIFKNCQEAINIMGNS
ncbi:MAG: fibronectin type III domain-containing protein, partial [Bacteroidales bacterium]|nr:fibronectin type III domain-containing protein [Bacteroidales bacterium]